MGPYTIGMPTRRPSRRSLVPTLLIAIGGVLLVAAVALAWRGARIGAAQVEECQGGAYAQALIEGAPRVALEIVESQADRNRGLMFRESLPWEQGMLFVFERPQQLSFWMRNTLIPLSIAYIAEDGTILDILDMDVEPEEVRDRPSRTYPSSGPALYALEVNQGWYAANGVQPGDRLLLCR